MIRGVQAGERSGSVKIPASKSQAHRLLICAALSDKKTTLVCDGISADISATIKCLEALGAKITVEEGKHISIEPVARGGKEEKHLYCGESGSTFRFMMPIACALGVDAVFHLEGRLPQRPMELLYEVLGSHGITITEEGDNRRVSGQLESGEYSIAGNVSSQYISGLLMALPNTKGDNVLKVTGKVESENYILMTEDALRAAGIKYEKNGYEYKIPGNQKFDMPQSSVVEGDWSSSAFFLSMGALSDKGILVKGMNTASSQGDMHILDVLKGFGAVIEERDDGIFIRKGELNGQIIDASGIPDLVPVIGVVASAAKGETRIIHAERLRLKESDRLMTTAAMLTSLGADIKETEDGLCINGKEFLDGGETDSFNDHRIAMSAAVAATICKGSVTVNGAECVNKSYVNFWNDLDNMEVSK